MRETEKRPEGKRKKKDRTDEKAGGKEEKQWKRKTEEKPENRCGQIKAG